MAEHCRGHSSIGRACGIIKAMNDKKLHRRLAALVSDFGYADVHKTLSDIRRDSALGYADVRKTLSDIRRDSAHATKLPRPKTKKTAADSSTRKKPDAVAVVRSLNIADGERREFLLSLAQKYEAKQFMPNVTHVRSFLMRDHDDPARIKSRQQVTAKIFRKLAAMTVAELLEIEAGGFYGPPKRLASYAEAITNYGQRLRESPQKPLVRER